MDKIVGLMWNRNESDILNFTISKALDTVDYLMLADDDSTDNSFEIMESFKNHPKVVLVKKFSKPSDKRQELLNEVKANFRHEDTLVQVIESDITVLQTDIHAAWKKYASKDVAMSWYLINATVNPSKGWRDESSCFPDWSTPIDEVMKWGHWQEQLNCYTFRPMPAIAFVYGDGRPWPRGSGAYGVEDTMAFKGDAPLLAHYGYRGPSHFYHKYNKEKDPNRILSTKHKWHLGSVDIIKQSVPYFNGIWNNVDACFPLNRQGWKNWLISPNRPF